MSQQKILISVLRSSTYEFSLEVIVLLMYNLNLPPLRSLSFQLSRLKDLHLVTLDVLKLIHVHQERS